MSWNLTTNKMYALCVSTGICKEPRSKRSQSHSSYYGNSDFDNYPVIYVDWNQAKTYCEWANRRLPTEAEWEKAASWDDKSQTKNVYPWGNSIDCSFANNYYHRPSACVGDTTKVGSYESGQSPYGVYDMAGNVWEWVADWYDANYYVTLGENARNPQGPTSGKYRVLRGGSWYYDLPGISIGGGIPSADRSRIDPWYATSATGFRCAMSANP